jgi:hypothetical protein
MKIKTTEESGAAIRLRRKELKVTRKELAFARNIAGANADDAAVFAHLPCGMTGVEGKI